MISKIRAKEVADMIRSKDPSTAATIDKMIREGNSDHVNIDVDIKYRLEKFDGDPAPGQQPVAVIEGIG